MFHTIGLFLNPQAEWEKILAGDPSAGGVFLRHTWLFALIPPLCGYYGTTQLGWSLGNAPPVKLTEGSAAQIAVLYYLAILVVTFSMASMIRWMSTTYGARQSFGNCMALASYSATPLFLVGALEAYPVLWVNLLAGLPALAFTIYLFYTGVPVVMNIAPERGFLLSSAMLAFGLVALTAMLAVTALLWGFGVAPNFTS